MIFKSLFEVPERFLEIPEVSLGLRWGVQGARFGDAVFQVSSRPPILGTFFGDVGAQRPPKWRALGGHLDDFLAIL